MELYRVVDLVEPNDAGLQTHLVLPGIFPVVPHTDTQSQSAWIMRLQHALATPHCPYLTAKRNT